MSILFALDAHGDLCAKQADYLAGRIQARVSSQALVAAAATAQIIFVGETHFEIDNHYYPTLLKKLKFAAPDLDCVTFELGSVKIPADDFSRPQWKELAEEARTENLKIFKVDHCNPHPTDPSGFICLEGRNEAMSANLAGLLDTGACKKILQVNGAQHLEHGMAGTGPTLPERLKAQGVSVFKIRLVDTAIDFTGGVVQAGLREMDPWIWGQHDKVPTCSKPPPILKENFGFLNISGSEQVPLTLQNSLGWISDNWSNYDGALVLGCPSQFDDHCAN